MLTTKELFVVNVYYKHLKDKKRERKHIEEEEVLTDVWPRAYSIRIAIQY
jgi:hypothetical protein